MSVLPKSKIKTYFSVYEYGQNLTIAEKDLKREE
jgi:hypothetical protein